MSVNADARVTDLDEIVELGDGDWHYVVDTSDTSESPEGTGKKAKQVNIIDKLESLKLRLTADGAITAGQAVEFLEGKLKAGGGDNLTQASEVQASSNNGGPVSACVLSDSKFAVVFVASGGTLQCIIGTISGATITYGTEVQADAATSCAAPSVCALSDSKIAISYFITGAGKCIVATVSGTVPTFGSSGTFKSATIQETAIVALSASLFAVSYSDAAGLTQIIAATVSSTVPTFGSAVTVSAFTSNFNALVKLNSTTVFGFTVAGAIYGVYYLFTFSSSTLTLHSTYATGTTIQDAVTSSAARSFTKINSDTLIHVFRGGDSAGYARLLSFNGVILKISPDYQITPAASSANACSVTKLDENRAIALFNSGVTTNAVAYFLEIQNETIAVKGSIVVSSTQVANNTAFLLSPRFDKIVAVYNRSSAVKSRLTQVSKYIGIAAASVADTALATATTQGVSAAVSNLTPGVLYYTNSAGVISTDSTGRFIGIAVSSTKLLLQNRLDRATASRADLIDSVPVAYTPTFTGFGTVTVQSFRSWRVGSLLFVRGSFTSGTATATEARVSLGYKGVNNAVTSSADIVTLEFAGIALRGVAGTVDINITIEASKTYITFTRSDATQLLNPLSKVNADIMVASGNVMSVNFCVPITGW